MEIRDVSVDVQFGSQVAVFTSRVSVKWLLLNFDCRTLWLGKDDFILCPGRLLGNARNSSFQSGRGQHAFLIEFWFGFLWRGQAGKYQTSFRSGQAVCRVWCGDFVFFCLSLLQGNVWSAIQYFQNSHSIQLYRTEIVLARFTMMRDCHFWKSLSMLRWPYAKNATSAACTRKPAKELSKVSCPSTRFSSLVGPDLRYVAHQECIVMLHQIR